MTELKNISELSLKYTDEILQSNNNFANKSALKIILITVICLLLGLGIGFILSKLISEKIDKMLKGKEKYILWEMGPYSLFATTDNDDLGKLTDAIRGVLLNSNRIYTGIIESSEGIHSVAKQLSETSNVLSQGATEQASSVEELTASLEEISAQTKRNADNANMANELAEAARKNAALGNTQMNEMLKAMDEINVSSNNIQKLSRLLMK